MLETGVTVVLGTDNAMFNSPNIFDELKFGHQLVNQIKAVDGETMLKMITLNVKKILNPKYYISLAPGTPSNFMVLDIPKNDIFASLVKGLNPGDIRLINIGTSVWKRN